MNLNSILSIFKKDSSTRNTAFVNIISFAVSIAVFVLIALYIQFELNFDKQLPKNENMYRFVTNMYWESGAIQNTAVSPVAASGYLVKDIPEIEDATSFIAQFGLLFSYENKNHDLISNYENNVLFVDSVFPDFFPLKMKYGKAKDILNKPNVIILSEDKAKLYFADNNPIGERIKIDGIGEFEVAGIMENTSENIHIFYDVLVSGKSLPEYINPTWRDLQAYTYIHKKQNSTQAQIEAKFELLLKTHMEMYIGLVDFGLQPVNDIHLHNNKLFDIAKSSDIKNIYFLFAIGAFVLMIALINFVNLNSIIYQNRKKELGIRKILGAKTNSILSQFFLESGLITTISVIISIGLMVVFFPKFKSIIDYSLNDNYFANVYWFFAGVIILGAFTGGLAILDLTRNSSLSLINPWTRNRTISKTTRQKALVIFQFSLTTILLIGVLVIMKQLSFVNKKDLGFNKDHVMYVEILNDPTYQASNLFKLELQKNPSVKQVGLSNRMPVEPPYSDHFFVEGFEKHMPLNTFVADYNFFNTIGFSIINGRNFSKNIEENRTSCIINETALKKFGWTADEAIGKKFSWNFGNSFDDQIDGKIIGVVKDFHYSDLHNLIEPIVITNHVEEYPVVSIKLASDNMEQAIAEIKNVYQQCNPDTPLQYYFLDERIVELYADDYKLSKLISIFNVLAIIISCIGLFNLAAINIKQRVKEIGVRKVNGATVSEIMKMLNKDFVIWVAIAFVIACPAAYFLMNKWLENFTYKTDIQLWLFALAGIIALGIALLTVSWQTFKAARRNPVEALRYE